MYSCTSKERKLEESITAVSSHKLSHGTLLYPYQQRSRISMMLIVLVCASDRCGNNINPASSRKVFKRFRKVLKAKKFLDMARHRLDTYSGSRIHRLLRGPSRAFSGRGICHFFRRDIGKVCFKIAGYGMRCTHGTRNFLIFLFGKREKYEMIG